MNWSRSRRSRSGCASGTSTPTSASAPKRVRNRWPERFRSPSGLPRPDLDDRPSRHVMPGLAPGIFVGSNIRHDACPGHPRPLNRDDDLRSPGQADPAMTLPSEVDVAVIGAGAAGLGAALALEHSGLSVIVLEARGRSGGRAHTILAAPDITFDLGCGWLHSADKNSFVEIARQLNYAIDKPRPPWREQSLDTGFPPQLRAEFIKALDAFYDRAEEAAKDPRDAAATTCLEPGNRWNPMIDAISTYINGCTLDRVSLHDMDAYEDTEINWRVPRGYGPRMAASRAPLPVPLNPPGPLLDHSRKRAKIHTSPRTPLANQV